MSSLRITRGVNGRAGITFTITASDSVQDYDDLVTAGLTAQNSDNKNFTGLLITVESFGIKVAFGVNPVQGGLGHVIPAATSLKISNSHSIRDLRFINETNGSNAVLQITAEYQV